MTAPPQDRSDADAVVGRAVGRLWHEQDGQRLGHHILVTEQRDGTLPAIEASSYAADDRLLAELRAGWPAVLDVEVGRRGNVPAALTDRGPSAAIRLGTDLPSPS
jgi:hypothetical protein